MKVIKSCPLIIFYTLAPTLKCYRCQPGEDCFQNNSTGTSVDCVDPDNTACYKIKVGKIQLKGAFINYVDKILKILTPSPLC